MDEKKLAWAREYINNIDFSKTIRKMVLLEGWIEKDAIDTCEQYRNFLFLKIKYGHQYDLPPSVDIDFFWHAHILSTKEYMEHCEQLFGPNGYLHHYPYVGLDGVSIEKDQYESYAKTCELYFKEFGKNIRATRTRFAKPIYHLRKFILMVFKGD